ncbi:uncharacterized protein [Antedon mediterranea]|uniref:uncharacterized protein isoform X2 n=1 Tax=Antedon mediterranea TaxID=105859 RepID=UPI003AF65584
MGNTESQDESELYQVRDSHIRRDSIPALAADNNLPIEPPELEADLSHLTVEEKKHIQDVLDRARDLEATEEDRIRNLEEDFTSYAESLLSRFTDTESLKDKNFCPICQVTVLSPDALPGTAQEGLPCADCERPVCLQCGFYVTSVATKKDVWLCNMCYHRRHLIASSGSWYHRQRGKPSGSGRRSSLDEATMAINAGRSEGIRFERTASFSEYENIRDSVLESVDIQYVPKVADELRKVASEGLERSGISEIISTGVKFLDQRSSSDETPDDQQHNRQRDSNHSLPENTMTSSFSASDSGLESMRDEDITPTLAEESRTSLDLDDEEMRKMLMQMSGKESTDAKRNQKQDEVIVENTEISVDSVKTISQQQDEIARPNGSTSGRVVASSIHDLPAIKERKSILDSDEFKSIEEQIYSHTEGFKEIFKSFNFGGEKISAGSTSSLDRESSDGHDFDEDDYEEEDLQMEALDIDHTSTVSHDDTATDKTLSPYREEIEMMLANGKRNYSLDCESLSDSEIRVCGGKTKSKVVIGEKPSHAISDPKLSERGRSLLTAEDYLQQGCFLGKNTAKSSSFYGFPSEKEEKPEMRYRSVGDLTKLGMETESEQLAKANKTNRTATPVIVKSQFQYPSNRKQKPNSLPKRKRSRRMIENPLSPIWDVDTSGSPPDADYSSGDFPSPEYADPSLAEESPLEYEDEEDIDIEEESMYDNTIHHYSKDSQMNDIYGSGDLADLLEEDDEDEEFRLHEEYSRKSSLTPEDAFQLETVMEEEEEEYEIQEQLPSPEKISTGSSEKVVENNEVLFESFSSDADSKEDVSIKTPKPRPPPLKLYHDHTKVTPVSTVSSKSDTQVLESPPTPIETSKSFEKPILAKIGDTVTSPDTSKQQNKTNENTLTEKKKPPTPKPRHKPPAPPPIPPKPSLSSIQRTQSQKGVSSVKEIKQTFQQTSQVATKTSKFVQESPQSPRLLATFRQSTEQEGSSIVGREGESLQEKVQQFEQFIRDTSSSPLPESPKRISRSRKNSDSSDNSTLTTELKQENKTGEPRPTAAVRKHVPATKDGNIEGDDAKSTATVATSTSKEDGEVSTKSVTRIASSRKHQRVSVGTETVPEKENDDNEGDKAPIAVMYTTKGTHLLSIRSNQPDSTDVHQLESPSISPTCPTTSSIAVGTSPEGSPPTSDSESLFVPKTKMFREKGVGTDQDVSTAVSSTSSRGSSGSSTPEMIVKRNSKRLPVTDASTTPLMPTSSSRQHTSEGQSEYSSKMFTLPGKPPSHKRHASGIQAQGSDVSDSDSERGGNSETMSKIRRRLPPVPSTRLSITSVGMTADSANEESDSDKTLNLQYIREMLRRKAAELEKQKLEVERAGKKTEEDKKRLDMTAARIFRRQERRQKGTGMIFDVDEMVMMHDSESKSSDDERSKSMSDLDDVLRPFSHGFQLTKSEEDIIKQIEKQISESTGTQYKAYERSEIEREVRQKYGLSDDLRRISTAQRKKHDSRCTHSDGEFEDTIYDSHMSRKKFQSDASVRRTNSSSPPVLRQYRTKDKKRLIDEEKLSKEGELIERKIREDQERQFRKEIERRKRQMEESAKRLEQIKAQRRSDWTGQTSKLSQSMGDIQRTDNRHLGAGMKTMSDAQLDETDGSHTLSLSSPYLPDRGQSVLKRDAHGLILPLDDTPSQSIRRDYQSIQEGREDIPNFKSGSDSSDTRGYRSSRQTDGSSDSDSYQHRNERRRYDSIGRETSSQVHGVMLGKPLLSPSKSAPQRSMGSSPIPVSSTQSYPNLEADYYYSSQEVRMEASEWTRRGGADDSDVEEYRSAPIHRNRQSSFSSYKSEPTVREYSFPTKKFYLSKDPSDRSSRGNGLGMRIIGGKFIPGSRQVGAYIAEIYPGGVAEKVPELQLGDEILEWCGVSLEGKTYEETQQLISGSDGEVEIVIRSGVCMMDSPRKSASSKQTSHGSRQFAIYETDGKCTNGVDPRTLTKRLEGIQSHSPSQSSESFSTSQSTSSNTSTPKRKRKERMKSIKGEIELQLDYDDNVGDLFITVIKARDLAPKDRNGLADPFVKICLLPGRCAENKRRTMYVPRTLNPNWNQTFLFRGIRRRELCTKSLEILVWDYDRFSTNDFMGQVMIDLSNMDNLDNNPKWYKLQHQGEVAPAEAHTPQLVSPIKPGGFFLQPPAQMTRPKTRSEQSTSDPAFWKRVSDGTSYPVSAGQIDNDSPSSSAYEYDTDRSISDVSAIDRDHPQNSDSGVHLIGQMSPEEHPDISTSLTRIDDAIRALKLTDQPIPIKRDKPTLRTRASSKSPKRHQRQRPQSANFDLRISRMQKPTESYEAQEMKRSLSTSPPVTDRQFYTQERPSYFKHPAHSSVELNSPFLVAHNQSSRSSSSHTLDSPSSSNNQLKDKTPSPDVVISADVRHKPKESIRVANFNPKNHHDNRHSNKSLSTPPDQPNSGSSSETDKRKRSGSNQISKSTIKADVVIHNEQPRRRSKTHSDDSIGTRSDSSQMSRKPRRKTSRDEDPLNFTSRDPKRRPSYDGGDTIQSAHDESRTESPVFKLQETHARTPYASHYMSDDRPRTSSCHFTTNTTPVHDRKRQDSGVYPRSVTNERVRKRKKTKGSNADSEIAARRLCDLADSNSQLWSRQFESNDRQSSINMKTAVYTRMLIGDNLGPGQVVDPELPPTRESTGEIKLGLKKDKRSDGDYFYVDIIQCRKMTFKLKDTDHIPDVYVKLFLFMGNKKVSKKKSHTIKQQLEPVFSQEFIFHKPIIGASLQVMLWADGGRFSRNTMVGETMIWLDNVDMSSGKVTAWYRLFTPSSPRTP